MPITLDLPDDTVSRLTTQAQAREQSTDDYIAAALHALAMADPAPAAPTTESDAAAHIDQAHQLRSFGKVLTDAFDAMRGHLAAYFEQAGVNALDSGHHKASLTSRRKIDKAHNDEALAWLRAQGADELIVTKESIDMKGLETFLETAPETPPAYFNNFSTWVTVGK